MWWRRTRAMAHELRKLQKETAQLQRTVQSQARKLQSHQRLLSSILISHELTAVGPLKWLQELNLEFLRLIDAICVAHDLPYWLDCGTLLGAVRHGGFIPWDDDIDLAMQRADYWRFLPVLENELNRLGLDDCTTFSRHRQNAKEPRVDSGHLQIGVRTPGYIAAMLDVFPYDFVTAEGAARLERTPFRAAVLGYRQAQIEDGSFPFAELRGRAATRGSEVSRTELAMLAEHSAPLGIVLEGETEFLAPGLDSNWYYRAVPVDQVLPLSQVRFSGAEYPAPAHVRKYLVGEYGESYLDLPGIVAVHDRLGALQAAADGEADLAGLTERLRTATLAIQQRR